MMKSNFFSRSSSARAVLAAGVVAAASLRAFAGDADDKLAKSVIEPEDDTRVHALLQVEVGDHYITPRGLDVVDKGVTIQPLVVIMFDLYKSKEGFLNDIQLWGSIWNDWGTTPYPVRNSSARALAGNWNEIDPAVGMDFKFAKGFDLNLAYTGFRSETDSYKTSTNFDAKLTYHDSFMGKFSLNPSVEFFQETSNKATVAFNYATDGHRGYYFSLGLDPTYKCDPFPLTIEIPSFVNIVSENFYQKFNGTNGGSGAAVISTGIKFSTPLSFIPKNTVPGPPMRDTNSTI